MTKITLADLHRKMTDLDIEERELRPYFKLEVSDEGPFNPVLVPNPDLVEATEEEMRAESALTIANHLSRWRRRRRAERRLERNEDAPLIVTEGDSWFQFPLFLEDVVDNLAKKYIPWSLGAAGDTVSNMVLGRISSRRTEYLRELKKHKNQAKAFVFSGAGNDVIGDLEDGTPALLKMLKRGGHVGDPLSHLDLDEVNEVMTSLDSAYRKMIRNIRRTPGLEPLPILIHGYDYAIPGPEGDRTPFWGKSWLSGPLDEMNIRDTATRAGIIRTLINELYSMMIKVSRDNPDVYVVDLRGTLPTVDLWADEIHPTDDGYARVTARFEAVLDHVIR